ncbi:MAG: hypothetical protein IT184_04015 [Acidobacteria bacterium]|nr:hypothetical protein [Acidobacteriota bacterium]
MRRLPLLTLVAAAVVAMSARVAAAPAGDPPSPQAPAAAQAAPGPASDPDLDFQPLQPDFTLVNLPTTLRLARNASAFRVTHRFTRPLNQGSVGSLFADALGIDSSAQIGLEYRYGIFRGTQIGFRRTNDRTIELFTHQSVAEERDGRPVSVAVFGSIDGTNNFRGSYSPALGAIVSRRLGSAAMVYVTPMWVNNSNSLPAEVVDDNDTTFVGIAARIRLRRTVYVVAEVMPRIAGYDPGDHQASIAIEKVVGGHAFQLNVSNGIASTIGSMARGAGTNGDWFLGFNISRKFF